MTNAALFLHVTDPHLVRDGTPLTRDAQRAALQNLTTDTKETALNLTFQLLAARLKRDDRKLDAILFTGDAQDRSQAGGHDQLFEMMISNFKDHGIDASRIVATPGNHDVPKGSAPGSRPRYKRFVETWRDKGCVTPWLDGVDTPGVRPSHPISLVGDDKRWAVYSINSSNWSQSSLSWPAGIRKEYEALSKLLKKQVGLSTVVRREILEASVKPIIERMLEVDVARVSQEQMEIVRSIVRSDNAAVKIALTHHHLLPPGIAEEIRAWSDFTNLGYLRRCLRQMAIDIVAHGHKHIEALSYDYIYERDAPAKSAPHRVMTMSGGTYNADEPLDRPGGAAARLIYLSGLPGAPRVEVERIPLGVRGLDLDIGERVGGRLWRTNEFAEGAPFVIQGSDINEIYAPAVQAADEEAKGGMLVVHFDRSGVDTAAGIPPLPFPTNYPDPDAPAEAEVFTPDLLNELVS